MIERGRFNRNPVAWMSEMDSQEQVNQEWSLRPGRDKKRLPGCFFLFVNSLDGFCFSWK